MWIAISTMHPEIMISRNNQESEPQKLGNCLKTYP